MSNSKTRSTTGRNQRRLAAQRAQQRRRLTMLGGAVAIALVVVLGLILINRDSGTSKVVAASVTFDASIPRDGQALGNPDAPVTVEIWSDYQCPYCKLFSEGILPQLVNEYVATGQVQVIYRDFAFLDRVADINNAGTPVANGNGDSVRAAEAAACAADQGLFWEYHAALFANQGEENAGNYSGGRLKEMAGMVGLDTGRFGSCLDDNENRGEVLSMYHAAVTAGVDSTPTVIVNGKEVSVGMYAQLKEAIDAELAA